MHATEIEEAVQDACDATGADYYEVRAEFDAALARTDWCNWEHVVYCMITSESAMINLARWVNGENPRDLPDDNGGDFWIYVGPNALDHSDL